MSKTFTQADVASHNKPNDLYIVVDEDVYDLTKFQDEHPGIPYPSPTSNSKTQGRGLTQRTDRRKEDPHPGRRQRRLEAILEIPQRRYPEKIQGQATSRLSRHQESVRTTGRGEEGDREAEGGEWGCDSCACRPGRERDVRSAGSVWRSDSVCGSELVSRCTSPPFQPLRRYLRVNWESC
jgi:Cytochrome b5-like Heme/Steroid binding domain